MLYAFKLSKGRISSALGTVYGNKLNLSGCGEDIEKKAAMFILILMLLLLLLPKLRVLR